MNLKREPAFPEPRMRVGDSVRITARYSTPRYRMCGVITKLRVGTEWYVRLEDGSELSWRESSMELTDSDYQLAVQVLGEDYFA